MHEPCGGRLQRTWSTSLSTGEQPRQVSLPHSARERTVVRHGRLPCLEYASVEFESILPHGMDQLLRSGRSIFLSLPWVCRESVAESARTGLPAIAAGLCAAEGLETLSSLIVPDVPMQLLALLAPTGVAEMPLH